MQSSTGRWVIGDNFYNRQNELALLESHVRRGNHLLLTGQRRMGKTSIARELSRRLESEGWVSCFADVEGATCPEDVIADIAEAVHPIRSISSRFAKTMQRLVVDNIEEISASEFRVKIRAGLSGSWQSHGRELLSICADHDSPVLLIIDELPIFLMRMLRNDKDARRVDEFMSWLRGVFQGFGGLSPVLMVSGSIGLSPLLQRLGMPDRINYLYPFRLQPWSREVSVGCFELLADSHGLIIDDGVAEEVYKTLGIGIPHHVQSYFSHLRDFAEMKSLKRITVSDVGSIYQTELLGPSGQNDLVHYETRLRNAMEEWVYRFSLEILAETATQDRFTESARLQLERWYLPVDKDSRQHIEEALDVLVHDGYIEAGDGGYRIPFQLLKDWWAVRYRNHHIPLEKRTS